MLIHLNIVKLNHLKLLIYLKLFYKNYYNRLIIKLNIKHS